MTQFHKHFTHVTLESVLHVEAPEGRSVGALLLSQQMSLGGDQLNHLLHLVQLLGLVAAQANAL